MGFYTLARGPVFGVNYNEPQSFLHPRAVRHLIDIFRKDYPQHQYIIATHSPQVIASAHPCAVIQLTHDGNETTVTRASSDNVAAIKGVLQEVGARLSDLFSADRILWVEGPTEACCFPLILESYCYGSYTGTEIVAVDRTGDILGKKKRNIEQILSIYQRLSEGHAVMPPALAFVFDREGLNDTDIEEFKRQKIASLEFIRRRMYENYLINPAAIVAVINADLGSDDHVTEKQIAKWIEEHRSEYVQNVAGNRSTKMENWRETVDGAKLLKTLFAELTNHRIEYDKLYHGEQLTRRILEDDPAQLEEVAEFLIKVMALK